MAESPLHSHLAVYGMQEFRLRIGRTFLREGKERVMRTRQRRKLAEAARQLTGRGLFNKTIKKPT